MELPAWQRGFDNDKFRRANEAAALPPGAPTSGASRSAVAADPSLDDSVVFSTASTVTHRSQESFVPAAELAKAQAEARLAAQHTSPPKKIAGTVLTNEDEAMLDDLLADPDLNL